VADTISVVDCKMNKVMTEMKWPSAAAGVKDISTAGCSDYFLMATGVGHIQLVKFPALKLEHSLAAHAHKCYSVDMHPEGRYILSGGADGLAALWDTSELICEKVIHQIDSGLRIVKFSHTGQFIAIASESSRIEIFETETTEQILGWSLRGDASSLCWNPRYLLLAYTVSSSSERDEAAASVTNITPSYLMPQPPPPPSLSASSASIGSNPGMSANVYVYGFPLSSSGVTAATSY